MDEKTNLLVTKWLSDTIEKNVSSQWNMTYLFAL